jgi:hypothetical protein
MTTRTLFLAAAFLVLSPPPPLAAQSRDTLTTIDCRAAVTKIRGRGNRARAQIRKAEECLETLASGALPGVPIRVDTVLVRDTSLPYVALLPTSLPLGTTWIPHELPFIGRPGALTSSNSTVLLVTTDSVGNPALRPVLPGVTTVTASVRRGGSYTWSQHVTAEGTPWGFMVLTPAGDTLTIPLPPP